MRCPKCHYLSFDPEPRCKNCGYDLEVADAELALRTAEVFREEGPDLQLHARETASSPLTLHLVSNDDESRSDVADAPTRPARPIEAANPQPRTRFRAPPTTTELPLFVKAIPEHEALSTQEVVADRVSRMPAAPRSPLSVRRTAPDVARRAARTRERRLGPLDNDLLDDLRRVEQEEAALAHTPARAHAAIDPDDEGTEQAPPSQRAGAAALDGLLLVGIGTFVFWATLRLCGVGPLGLGVASIVPLGVFLAAVALSYLLMFTMAGGQTVGKMLVGIRVVGDAAVSGDNSLTFGQAAWRASLALASVLALGLGWIPALFGRGLPLHDRLAHTRVVRV